MSASSQRRVEANTLSKVVLDISATARSRLAAANAADVTPDERARLLAEARALIEKSQQLLDKATQLASA